MIPAGIDHKALFAAARYIDVHGVPITRRSRHWDVVIDGQVYPPKYVVSIAAKFATGKTWPATRFITTEARDFLTTREFEIRNKGDAPPMTTVPTRTAILLTWKDDVAYGFTDVLTLSLFSKRQQHHIQHPVQGPKGGLSFAMCNVKSRGRTAELDYQPFAKFNKQQGNELGVTRLTFEDADRTSITAVEWKRAGGAQFSKLPFEIPKYLTETEPAYTPPKKGSKKVLRAVRERPGQAKFRKKLKAAYAHTCCITGCTIAEALEGAHIDPYLGIGSDNVKNGLLLRRDLHALFDADLIGIEPATLTVRLAAPVHDWPDYSKLDHSPLLSP